MSRDFVPPGSLNAQIWQVLELLDEPVSAPNAGYRLDDLAGGFESLAGSDPEVRASAEQTIWAAWCDHPDPAARAAMARGIRDLSDGALVEAEAIFDELIEDYPDWAEAWNKRATVLFLMHRDAMSVMDIHRTLELEPRHYGALGGFAQICVRNGAPDAARQALSRLLTLNPHAPGIAETVAALGDDKPKTIH